MLETQIKRFENKEPRLKQFEMNKLITSLKKELPWLCEVSIHSLQNICKDLDTAYDRLFKGTSKRPKFKSKRKAKPSFPVRSESSVFYFKDGLVKIPVVGKLKYKADYPGLDLEKVTAFRNARISFVNGKWILSFAIEYENQVLKDEEKHGSIGIDLGVGRLAVVAYEGIKREYININKTKTVRNLNRKLAHVQKVLSRKYEASKKNGKDSKQKSKQILKYEALLKRIYHRLACIRLNQRQQIKHGSIGIDLGVGRLAVVAYEGIKREYININKTKTVRNLNRKLAHVQKVLSRKYEASKKNGKDSKQKSKQILKYEALLKRIYHRLACIRLNQRQQITREIVKSLER